MTESRFDAFCETLGVLLMIGLVIVGIFAVLGAL